MEIGMKHPFTPQADQILADARREARQLNHAYVGTEHILLALLAGFTSSPPSALRLTMPLWYSVRPGFFRMASALRAFSSTGAGIASSGRSTR